MVTLSHEQGYVFLVVFAAYALNGFLSLQVVWARKKYSCDYPNLYLPKSAKNAMEFNSIQRAHQNTLESLSFVLLQVFLCSFVAPKESVCFGMSWVMGKFMYGWGYAKGGPNGRKVGGLVAHLGDIPLAVLCIKCGLETLAK